MTFPHPTQIDSLQDREKLIMDGRAYYDAYKLKNNGKEPAPGNYFSFIHVVAQNNYYLTQYIIVGVCKFLLHKMKDQGMCDTVSHGDIESMDKDTAYKLCTVVFSKGIRAIQVLINMKPALCLA